MRILFLLHKREKGERVRDYKPLKGRKEWESCFYYVKGERVRDYKPLRGGKSGNIAIVTTERPSSVVRPSVNFSHFNQLL